MSAAAGKFGDQMSTESYLAAAAHDTLHGARELPPDEPLLGSEIFLIQSVLTFPIVLV